MSNLNFVAYQQLETFCGGNSKRSARTNLDRIDNSVGYKPSNVVVACPSCNLTRADRFTHEEFVAIGKAIRREKLQRAIRGIKVDSREKPVYNTVKSIKDN
jgi:hypothetical protein